MSSRYRTFHITKNMIHDVTGMGTGTMDETVITTINVRLDEMFREALRSMSRVFQLHGDDLEKLLKACPNYRSKAVTLSTPTICFSDEEGISDQGLRDLNIGPQSFAQQLQNADKLVFCHSPMFRYKRERHNCEISLWLHAVLAPY